MSGVLDHTDSRHRVCDGYYDDGVMPTRCTRTRGCGLRDCPAWVSLNCPAHPNPAAAATGAPKEAVNHPGHYGGADNPYEVIKVLKAWGLEDDAILWNVIKYVARAGKKDPAKHVEDLEKALFYLDYRIKTLRNKK